MGGTIAGLPVIGAVEGNALTHTLTNLPLVSPNSTLPTLSSILPGGTPVGSLNSIPVLGSIIEGGTTNIVGVLPVLAPPTVPGGQPTLLGVLTVLGGGPLTPAQLATLANALTPSGAGLNLAPVLGLLSGTPPTGLLSGLPTSLLGSILPGLQGFII
jgi:hypothetical protein